MLITLISFMTLNFSYVHNIFSILFILFIHVNFL